MSDNPFAEHGDDDRTVIGPATRPAKPAAAGEEATRIAPARAPLRAPARAAAAPAQTQADPLPAAGGTAPLVAAAAPLLQLLARLRNTLTPPDPGDLRARTAREVRAFEERARASGTPPHLLRLAHYALCASLDDVVLSTPWGSTGPWSTGSLVSTFHQEVQGGERFFDILDLARQTPARFAPVLEMMYRCLSLGFMGRYRLSPRGPAEIDQLREDLYTLLVAQRATPDPELSPAWRGVAAPYRPVRTRLPVWVAGSAGLAVLGVGFVWVSISVNTASDAVYARALQVPPPAMPVLARAAPVQQVVQPPAEPGARERLRTFLQPEIEAGLVEVFGTEDTPVVRVRQGLFGSGSATVQPPAVPVLERIGAALKDEPGAVQVLGYTDDAPIRTVRFPSNYQLSAARAEAARQILARSIGAPARLSAEGRADADPIASNATPEGREANRRIEIVLHRQS